MNSRSLSREAPVTKQPPLKKSSSKPRGAKSHFTGYSLPEVMIGSIILASAVSMSAQLTNSTMNGMQRMNTRSKLDSAMAARIEDIRDASFRHLCVQGCDDNDLTQQLKYNLVVLKPLCETSGLGSSLLGSLTTSGLASDFNLTSYDSTADPITINSVVTASGNQVNVALSEPINGMSVNTAVVAHAQGWCP